jgi:tetratricopeptide (TPR) repeat protein
LQKILAIFGYFIFFEYALISREYVLGVIALFLLCHAYEKKAGYIVYGVLLAFLANSTTHGLILAVAFGSALFIEPWFWAKISGYSFPEKVKYAFGLMLLFTAIYLAYWQLMSPTWHGLPTGKALLIWNYELFNSIFSKIFASFFPLPDVTTIHFWNTSILYAFPADIPLALVLSGLILLINCLIFMRHPLILFIYTFGTLCILLLHYAFVPGSLRHYGYFYLLFLCCSWLAYQRPNTELKNRFLLTLSSLLSRSKNVYLVLILSVQVCAGLYAYVMDIQHPFSNSKQTAIYLQKHGLDKKFVMGYKDYVAEPLTAYLNKEIYYPECRTSGTFINIGTSKGAFTPIGLLDKAAELLDNDLEEMILVLNYEMPVSRSDLQVVKLASFQGSIVNDEEYFIYHITRSASSVSINYGLLNFQPETALGCNEMAVLLYQNGKMAAAADLWQKALKFNPNENSLHNNLGVVKMQEGFLSAAESEFKQEIVVNPRYDNAYFNLGVIYSRQGKETHAVKQWQTALAINPEYIDAYKDLAIYFYQNKDINTARYYVQKLLDRHIQIDPQLLTELGLNSRS